MRPEEPNRCLMCHSQGVAELIFHQVMLESELLIVEVLGVTTMRTK